MIAHMTPFDPAYRSGVGHLVQSFMSQGSTLADATTKAVATLYRMVQQQALMQAFIDDFRLLGAVFLLLIPFVFIMRKAMVPGAPGAH